MPIKEIYTKDPSDINYQEYIIDHSDVYETVLSKIRMILYTKPGEVLGDPFFGVNLEEYVFSLNASNRTIKQKIEEQIAQYIPEALVMHISVNVGFKQRGHIDECYIDIKIDGTSAMGLIIS
jgi:phage baseplate assembly protein W